MKQATKQLSVWYLVRSKCLSSCKQELLIAFFDFISIFLACTQHNYDAAFLTIYCVVTFHRIPKCIATRSVKKKVKLSKSRILILSCLVVASLCSHLIKKYKRVKVLSTVVERKPRAHKRQSEEMSSKMRF